MVGDYLIFFEQPKAFETLNPVKSLILALTSHLDN
jgi:hypothetical protein